MSQLVIFFYFWYLVHHFGHKLQKKRSANCMIAKLIISAQCVEVWWIDFSSCLGDYCFALFCLFLFTKLLGEAEAAAYLLNLPPQPPSLPSHPFFLFKSLGNSLMDAKKSHWVLIKDQFPFFTLQSRSITDQPCACETKSTPGSCSLLLHYCLRCVVKTVDGIPEIKALDFQQH